jgi:hypothetical protein
MPDPIETVQRKVLATFRELVGERAQRLDGSVMAQWAMDALTTALSPEYGEARAANIALNMADWNWDAAFIVALHLFPERFTPEEIDAGIGLFLCHAPNHIREACRLTGQYGWESFPEHDEAMPAYELQSHSLAVARLPGKGRGVIAFRNYSAGALIERPPVIVIAREDVPLIRQTRLAHYYFEWGDDCQHGAIALGCGSLYNHSYTPNARYEFRESEECLEFIALRDIEPGEEITINYNNLAESAANPVKFDVR